MCTHHFMYVTQYVILLKMIVTARDTSVNCEWTTEQNDYSAKY